MSNPLHWRRRPLSGLPQRFPDGDRARHGHIERAQAWAHRDHQPRVGGSMNPVRRAGRFPPEQKNVAGAEFVGEKGLAGARREQNNPQTCLPPPEVESVPRGMPHERDLIEVIHSGTTESAVGDRKTRWLDEVRFKAQTGGEAQNRAGVLGNIGFEQSDPHGGPKGRRRAALWWRLIPANKELCDLWS